MGFVLGGLRQYKEFLVVDVFVLRVLDPDPEGLGATVVAVGPLECSGERERHAQQYLPEDPDDGDGSDAEGDGGR